MHWGDNWRPIFPTPATSPFLENFRLLERLSSPAPALVSLSLTQSPRPYISPQSIIPNSLFNGTAPKLMHLELFDYSIGQKSPLLKGLQTLTILTPSAQATPTLEDWLAALSEMSQLKTLILDNAIPTNSVDNPHISEPQRTVTLPTLTHFNIAASARDCALALEHLVLPALVSLRVAPKSQSRDGGDIRLITPYIARNAHGPQDTAPLQTILFSGDARKTEIFTWIVPDADVEVRNSFTLTKAAVSARLVLSVTFDSGCRDGMEPVVLDAILSHLPWNAISTPSVLDDARVSKELWYSLALRLTKLNRVLLVSDAVSAFGEMLKMDTQPDGLPRLPQLTQLILSKVTLTAPEVLSPLGGMLVKRKERDAPLEALDLRTCIVEQWLIRVFSKWVRNIQVPRDL